MHLGLSLRISPSLALRQTMEMALSQGLQLSLEMKIALTLYIKLEGALTRLYRNALRRKKIKLYEKHGMKFEYALVQAKDVPDDLKKDGNWAFSHCLYNKFEAILFGSATALARGSWLLFVIEDMIPDLPKRYIEYAAVHERGEQVTLGDHNLASKLEFAIAKKERKLLPYMAWIEEHCPAKFADVFSNQTHLQLPAAEEFQEILESFSSSEEATKMREMIEEFEWPYHLLQRLMHYKKQNERVIEIATRALRTAEILAGESGIPLAELIDRIRNEVTKQLRFITEQGLERSISYSSLNPIWRELRMGVDKTFFKTLDTKQKMNPNYIEEVLAAKIADALPRDGVLSLSFAEALHALS